MIGEITLASGIVVTDPARRLKLFCDEEYDYYDGIPSADPNRIEPVDVLVTVSMNAFFRPGADLIRAVHVGMKSHCEHLLQTIPEDADLMNENPPLAKLNDLLDVAVQLREVSLSRATKVLHRKRRSLIPMLDSVVFDYYFPFVVQAGQWKKWERRRRPASGAMAVLDRFREDLLHAAPALGRLQSELAQSGYNLSLVRILELLVWTQREPRGYYRSTPDTTPSLAVIG